LAMPLREVGEGRLTSHRGADGAGQGSTSTRGWRVAGALKHVREGLAGRGRRGRQR